jgi:ElaB/YqjD/DUF883 family membrane-anchored ribosome-binding protein
MSEPLSDDAQNPSAPDSNAQRQVSHPAQGIAPAWEPIEVSPIQPPVLERHVIEAARGLSLEPEIRSGAAERTAERIGSAVGSAQRQMRRGLELVSSGAAHLSHVERESRHIAAGTLQDIGGEVSGIGQKAARGFDKWSELAEERIQQLRSDMSDAPSRLRARVQQAAAQYPLQTIAAIAGVSFAVGVALRLTRRSHRG